jgi:porin
MGMVVSGAVNGNPTSLFLNAPYHATAGASWAARAKYQPTDSTYLETGVFQASPRIGNPAYHGADFTIQPGDGVLLMAEIGWTPDFASKPEHSSDKKTVVPGEPGRKGVYSFGAYFANDTFETFQGGTARHAYGFYAMAQQMVWRSRENPHHHCSLWGGVTYSPQEDLAQMPVMGFGGAIWQGLVPGRNQDNFLLSFYTGGFSRDFANAQAAAGQGRPTVETVLEVSYIVQLTKHLQLQPDVQWIIQPGGTGDIPNALVVGFQVGLTY